MLDNMKIKMENTTTPLTHCKVHSLPHVEMQKGLQIHTRFKYLKFRIKTHFNYLDQLTYKL